VANFLKDNLLLVVFEALFLAEQISIFLLLPYPCRYGLKVQTFKAPRVKSISENQNKATKSSLKLKFLGESECFLRYRYPPLVGGPYLFVIQAKSEINSMAEIRIGFMSLIFISYGIIWSLIFDSGFYGILNAGIMVALVGYFYLRVIKNYWRFMERLIE
jgi:hypothetical protein